MERGKTMKWLRPLCCAAGVVACNAATAQEWAPQRHVEFVSPTAAGSAMDNVTRTVERLARELKLVPVSTAVVNRPGGEHAVAYNYLHQRAGDPHYLGLTSQVLLTNHIAGVLPITYTDVTPIASLIAEHYILVVRSESAIKTGKDFIEALRQRPDPVSIAVGNLSQRMAAYSLRCQRGRSSDTRTPRM